MDFLCNESNQLLRQMHRKIFSPTYKYTFEKSLCILEELHFISNKQLKTNKKKELNPECFLAKQNKKDLPEDTFKLVQTIKTSLKHSIFNWVSSAILGNPTSNQAGQSQIGCLVNATWWGLPNLTSA